MPSKIAEIIIPNLPELDYLIPAGLEVKIGDLVIVPIRNSKIVGLVWKIKNNSEFSNDKLKAIDKNCGINLNSICLQFIKWTSDYYFFKPGHIFRMVIPSQINAYLLKGKSFENNQTSFLLNYQQPEFNIEQIEANKQILEFIDSKKHNIIIDGVTGSGKTEVYLNATNYILGKDSKEPGQVLIILPEIALTSQIINRITSRFSYAPITWHSNLTDKQRRENFAKIINGDARIIIGARSALFLPYKNLKMIIVDEEHDHSYKQEEGVTYQARDMAIMLAKLNNIPIILASASPSLETINNIQLGKLNLIELTGRYNDNSMPKINIIDMKKERRNGLFIAPRLISALKINLSSNQQSLLFINRKGYSPSYICSSCGHQKTCKFCSSSMIYHKQHKKLKCHQCGYEEAVPRTCPTCQSKESFIPLGPGIERLAEEVAKLIPTARVICLTQESFFKPKETELLLNAIKNQEYDIIIGTQIIAKGHHFPSLTLVGIIDADSSMMAGDLRASEKTFQLLQQVSGRAGREIENSNIYIQTFNPEHPLIISLANYQREEFIKQELKSREAMFMPPFARLGAMIISSKQEDKLINFVQELNKISPKDKNIQILGPAPALNYRVRGKFRYRFLVKCNKKINLQHFFHSWINNVKLPSSIHLKIDIDPYYFS